MSLALFSTAEAQTYEYVTQWGSPGSGDGQFNTSTGVGVDSSGNVYVSDSGNNRIQKFDSSGVFITKWGTSGAGDGQFANLRGVGVDSSGNVYVADSNNNRIQKFDSSGNFLAKWGSFGVGDGQFNSPSGVALDSSGNVYVMDSANNRIQKFDSSGNFLAKWGSFGVGDGQFDNPWGVGVDSSGNVYVSDFDNNRIQKFDSSGNFLAKWGSPGVGDGQFDVPRLIAVDSSGNVYVTDSNNDRIQKFDSSGVFITKWGTSGAGDGQISNPYGVAVDSSGNVYVADSGNRRIQKFALPAQGGSSSSSGSNSTIYHTLVVYETGADPAGIGRVYSEPAGIDCPGTCSASFADGTEVTLYTKNVNGMEFLRYEGDCAGVWHGDPCVLTMDGYKEVPVRFYPPQPWLTWLKLDPVTGIGEPVSFGDNTIEFTSDMLRDGCADITVILHNAANRSLDIGMIGGSDPLESPFEITDDTCSDTTLSFQSDCVIVISYCPSNDGPYTDTFDCPTSDPDFPSQTVEVTGGN